MAALLSIASRLESPLQSTRSTASTAALHLTSSATRPRVKATACEWVRPFDCHVFKLLSVPLADLQQDIRNRLTDELHDLADDDPDTLNTGYTPIPIIYHFTSIFQPSIWDALSKIVSRLMPCQTSLEKLLDLLCDVRAPPVKSYMADAQYIELQIRQSLPLRYGAQAILRN